MTAADNYAIISWEVPYARIAVFLCGAVIMVIELTGSRVLAPYLGTSLVVGPA